MVKDFMVCTEEELMQHISFTYNSRTKRSKDRIQKVNARKKMKQSLDVGYCFLPRHL